jgi:hypothetical protein
MLPAAIASETTAIITPRKMREVRLAIRPRGGLERFGTDTRKALKNGGQSAEVWHRIQNKSSHGNLNFQIFSRG